jgi:hypothetical protein
MSDGGKGDRDTTKFVTKSQTYAYVIIQEDAPNFVCDPKMTFNVEEGGGHTFLCKHMNVAEEKKDEETVHQKFPMDGCTVSPKDVDMQLYLAQFRPIRDKVLSLAADVGVSSSVWLLGRHSTQLNNNLLFSQQQEDDLFRATLSDLFLRMSSPTTHLNEFMRLSWNVHIKCFEVCGDQIIDLFLSKDRGAGAGAVGRTGGGESAPPPLHPPPKVRDLPQHGTTVVGLCRRPFLSPAAAYEALQQAFGQRRILIAETSVSGSRNTLFGQRVLGTVGCVFVQVEVEQVLYPSRLLLAPSSRGSFDPSRSFLCSSRVQFNILADIDALSFKPSRQDTVNIMSMEDFLLHGVSKPKDNGRPQNGTSTVNSSVLSSSHKALSTLSRILRLLAKQESTYTYLNKSAIILFFNALLSRGCAALLLTDVILPSSRASEQGRGGIGDCALHSLPRQHSHQSAAAFPRGQLC